jgi:SulP family sulfate permease
VVFDRLRSLFSLRTLKDDGFAGVVLGVESVPAGLASGLLAGINPIFGVYSYLYGLVGAAFFTSSVYMAVQATGAMSLLIADVPALHNGDDADRALFTLAILTGIVMIGAGMAKIGSLLRFVSNSVMVGFMTAVGVNIVLGQLNDFTGYVAQGDGRLQRAIDLVLHPFQVDLPSVTVGLVAVLLIIVLERTALGALGMVVAIVVGSALVPLLGWDVAQVRSIAEIPSGLPLPAMPTLSAIPELVIPALSLAFVGLVQGAGISASFPNPDGTYANPSKDFIGQGIGNVVSGIFRGMPAGGSTSATAILSEGGMRTSMAKIYAGLVMAVSLVFFAQAFGYIAMPALAGLLIVIGVRTVKPNDIMAVWHTGKVSQTVMMVTLVLTLVIPLQYAVLMGVAISMVLYVIRSSSNVIVKRIVFEEGEIREVDPPAEVGADDVIMLQLYGSIFFASAATYETLLPEVVPDSDNSVVILRIRGKADLGSTFIGLLGRYAESLRHANCRLVIMSVDPRVLEQLEVTGIAGTIGEDSIYPADDWLGRELRTVVSDAEAWVQANRQPSGE